jgi:hypothetical protein
MARSWWVGLALAAGFSVSVSAGATPRVFPADSFQVQLTSVTDPYLTVDGELVQMTAGVLIYGPTNTTVVKGVLQPISMIRIQFDGQCLVRRVWILTDEEITTAPVWSTWFSGGFVPPTCPSQ